MNLRDYLSIKYNTKIPKCLTWHEAKTFGIPYPPKPNWLRLYGHFPISTELAERLITLNEERRRRKKSPKQQALADRGETAARKALAVAQWEPKRADPLSSDFLQTYEWRRVRMAAIQKYGARCQCCGASAKDGVRMHVDHIKPRQLFPDLALHIDNLQILCEECNHGKGNWDMTDWREPQTKAE